MLMRDEVAIFKRERILEEAAALFYERGFHGASMDAIAERLGTTKPVIYRFYKNKSSLLVEIYLRVVERSLGCIVQARAADGSARERLQRFTEGFAQLIVDEQQATAVFFREENSMPELQRKQFNDMKGQFDTELAALLEEGRESGEFQVADTRICSLAIGGMISWMYVWYRDGGRLTPEAIVKHMVEYVERIAGASGVAV